ncbi:MAG: hypothetical protein E7404_01085 [Ruminococcaceae bacterium]|nr:hypothetical protein [Oscillospiraceae bacterium]
MSYNIVTKEELSQLSCLNKEIKGISERIAGLKYKIKTLKYNFTKKECEEMEKEIENLVDFLFIRQKKCIDEQKKLETFIEKIPYPDLRNIFALRYINGLCWQQVAFSIGEYDESYVRKKHNAYLKKLSLK